MNNKIMVDGNEANKQYLLRTTEDIYDTLAMYASSKGISVNVIMNKALLKEANRIKSNSSNNKTVKK